MNEQTYENEHFCTLQINSEHKVHILINRHVKSFRATKYFATYD